MLHCPWQFLYNNNNNNNNNNSIWDNLITGFNLNLSAMILLLPLYGVLDDGIPYLVLVVCVKFYVINT